MKKLLNISLSLAILAVTFLLPLSKIKAYTMWTAYNVAPDCLAVRSTPEINSYNKIDEIPPYLSFRVIDESGSFYKIVYGSDNTEGWVYNYYVKKSSNFSNDSYGRPWTTPGKAINGGAKVISSGYISKGQYTSYLKKFNVGVSSDKYTHQYMTNIRAPWGEARTSYSAYYEYLSEIAFTFTIPIYNDMPDVTSLSGMTNNGSKMSDTELNDADFETLLNNQGFPETYKTYLRALHKSYPKWQFKSLKTGINWSDAVSNEIPKSCIETSTDHGTGEGCGNESANWSMADADSVAYFMDPRNFLDRESIFMFEDLSSYENVNETMIQRILNGSFMSGQSTKDNTNYSTLFMSAGKNNSVNPVYLASLAIQEIGRSETTQTKGATFEYYGIRYSSLYNFFNIGASGSFTALGGLVWASGGSPSTYTFISDIKDEPATPEITHPTSLDNFISGAGYKIDSEFLKNIDIETTVGSIKNKISGATIKIYNSDKTELSDSQLVGTGSILNISNGETTYDKTIVINGDVDGDGLIAATDYVAIKNSIMDVITLTSAQKKAADMNSNLQVDANDYIAIKNYIMNH